MRNAFEARVANQLGSNWKYEDLKLSYSIQHTYLADFVDYRNKTIREAKGYFPPEDRRKMIAVKKQNPDWTFIMVFSNPYKTLNKTSQTTYAQWCDKNGFAWEQGPAPAPRKKKGPA